MKKIISCCVIFLSSLIYLFGCGKEEKNTCIYEDDIVILSITVPSGWDCERVEKFAGNDIVEGTPEVGLRVFLDESRDNVIFLFRQEGHISISGDDTGEDIVLNDNLRGTLFTNLQEKYVNQLIVLEDGFCGISIDMTQECYHNSKERIEEALRTIAVRIPSE